ncbi:Glutaredoxin [Mycena indigotica]|uniref:Glutaredoxin n=1 Tax=Mycena indigotica TaxID=2126181 RepID=A0A8H6SQP7_9AGAR|nr:Glutaredoxin [Mycena indigotica]KAF7303664.1 Glutaredoxin [Mycena indigotica]
MRNRWRQADVPMLSSVFNSLFRSPTTSESSMAVKDLVESAIADNKIMIFSKSYCPYCKRSKALFAKEFPNETPVIFELDLREDGDEIQSYLRSKTGQTTVPNVFINTQHVGGNDDTQAAFKTGKLTSLVNNV